MAAQENEGVWTFWVQLREVDEVVVYYREEVYRNVWAWAYDFFMRVLNRGDQLPFASGIRKES